MVSIICLSGGMMDFRHNPFLRVISVIVLTFFLWTFGGVFDIAYAFKNSPQSTVNSPQPKSLKPEEKFQKTVEDLEQILSSQPSAISIQSETKEKLKTKKSELESLDIEIRKQFAETEKKLKDAKLPDEILQRHYKFVKHYEDNLNELKANLEAIDKAQTKAESDTEIEKAKAFLEKTKPPKKHIPLDPNKLPHRTAEPTKKKPRLKKEEFKEIQDAGYTIQDKKHHASGIMHREPILVASNGSLTGLLDADSKYSNNAVIRAKAGIQGSGYPIEALGYDKLNERNIRVSDYGAMALLDSGTMQLALADPPTSSDLAETIEVQFTPEIKAKAQELGNNPVKIYEWVRNNIEYVPTYGSIQGANMCLQTKQCNDFDTASLLIALLRASNIPARYVYGTIELPIEKVKNWVGGFTDSNAALTLIASGGIPVAGITEGGAIKYVQMEHVWVEVYVPYGPYSGRPSKLNPLKTWIPLDVSFKQYTYTEGVDLQTAVLFDAQSFIDQIKSTATINETEGYVTNVNSNFIQTTLTDYQTQLQNYINQNMPNATVGDILGKKEIKKQEFGILPTTLPYKKMVAGVKYSEVPDSLRHKLTVEIPSQYYYLERPGLTYTVSLPEIAGKRVTISYDPATATDQSIIDQYIAQSSTAIPTYLVTLKPILKIEGKVMVTGADIGMGQESTLYLTFISPPNRVETETHKLHAGDYSGLSINPFIITQDVLQKRINKADFTEPVGEMLHQVGLSYWGELDAFNSITAKIHKVITLRHPSEGLVSAPIVVKYLFGIPYSASYKSRSIDVKRDLHTVISKDGVTNKIFSYLTQSGIASSGLEGIVFDQLFGRDIGDGVSAVRILGLANGQGIPIYQITSSNLSAILPKLLLSIDVKTDIQNAVNAGKTVKVPQQEITHNAWRGVGYIIQDTVTGAGAYMISGGLAGGEQTTPVITVYPLPQIPATGIGAWVIGSLAIDAGIFFRVAAGVIVGIELTPLIVSALIIALIVIIAKTIADTIERNKPPEDWRILRHYTDSFGLMGILLPIYGWQMIKASETGELGLGAYLTDYFVQPDNGGPISQDIATKLGIEGKVITAYVDVKIDWNIYGLHFIVANIRGATQYCFRSKNLIIDGKTVILERYYPYP